MLLVIDNYDSFTFNLVHYAQELGAETKVVRNDELSVEDALNSGAKAILLSPGPRTPDEAGICLDLIRKAPDQLPMLGICLGQQAMGQAFGGHVIQAKEIMHGKTSPVLHDGTGLFEGLDSPFEATRYHSLAVERDSLPGELLVNGWTEDGEIMGFRHATRPIHGLQFHPESIASENGHALIAKFLDIAELR
ncbi:aminodeoxychorismate/anthranilate synthase component II [Algimonas ampicilliniresistens]|jgi:anthranilate synthase component 2|uniref:Aminodeoxychorismate/anthranilate synthase component II n=1 Tax=Algimonas ampicilliniresistens TaxID=1298735 RepID=A0ABQ5V8M9_9PROT|nr:aminodeoxychorismate/anthranilate synthase component II [Algimonas ampicilliniresistens]GLQ23410.1 aminodeoxychorismate/anthranilate synthase component II [Algimonas ampicilliniresistens]